MNGHDDTARGPLAVHPRSRRGQASGRTQFLAWPLWVVLALLGMEYLSGYLLAVLAGGCCAWRRTVPSPGWTPTDPPWFMAATNVGCW